MSPCSSPFAIVSVDVDRSEVQNFGVFGGQLCLGGAVILFGEFGAFGSFRNALDCARACSLEGPREIAADLCAC